MKVKGTIFFILMGMIVTGCSKHQTPITKRDQMMLLSKADELSIGDKEYKRLLSCTQLCKDIERNKAIKRVGDRLIKAAGNSHIKHWEFILVDKKNINATCLPNGKVFINTGVFRVAKTDDQLATVLSHEMAHALARHGGARISRNKVVNGLGITTGIATALINPLLIVPYIGAYNATTQKYIHTPNSRLEEKEADEIGLHLMKKAGYDVNASIDFWNNMKKVHKHKGRKHGKTHFSYDQRIKDLKQVISRMNRLSRT